MRKIMMGLTLLSLCLSGMAQVVHIAPDIRWNDEIHSRIGIVNPNWETVEVVLTGYSADGTALGRSSFSLERERRSEFAARALFGETSAWVQVESSGFIAGYVRYERADGTALSITPLSRESGAKVFVPVVNKPINAPKSKRTHPNLGDAASETAPVAIRGSGEIGSTLLVNTADSGDAIIQPVVSVGTTVRRRAQKTATTLGLSGGSQIGLDYSGVFNKNENPLWDEIAGTDGGSLAAIHHFYDESGEKGGLASLALTRTSRREIVFTHLDGYREGRSKVVLINTYASRLPLTINAYNVWDQRQTYHIDLEPYERREIDISKPDQTGMFPKNTVWMTVLPFEGGLVAYHLFNDKENEVLAATEGTIEPGSTIVAPFTPTTSEFETELTLINMDDTSSRIFVYGFTQTGRRVPTQEDVMLAAWERESFSMTELFGDRADEVTWVRANATRARIMVSSQITRKDNPGMAIMHGIPSDARTGDYFFAEFEGYGIEELRNQGWRTLVLSDPERLLHFPRVELVNSIDQPSPGLFFSDHVHGPRYGLFHVGYRSVYDNREFVFQDRRNDTVVMVSNDLEVPLHGPLYLSWQQRFYNPEYATAGSNFGLVWRETGSDEWHWEGVNGQYIIDQDLRIWDCYDTIQYGNDVFTATWWIPFETTLPDSLRGKQIQVGLYYDFVADEGGTGAPWMLIDSILLSSQKREVGFKFERDSAGSFTLDESEILVMPEVAKEED